MKKKSRVKKFLDKNPKLRNPYFYISVIGLVFSAAGVDLNTLTTWQLLGEALVDIFNNPVSCLAVFTALLGIWSDNGNYVSRNIKSNENTQKPKDKL